jgi:hypothetical protein
LFFFSYLLHFSNFPCCSVPEIARLFWVLVSLVFAGQKTFGLSSTRQWSSLVRGHHFQRHDSDRETTQWWSFGQKSQIYAPRIFPIPILAQRTSPLPPALKPCLLELRQLVLQFPLHTHAVATDPQSEVSYNFFLVCSSLPFRFTQISPLLEHVLLTLRIL